MKKIFIFSNMVIFFNIFIFNVCSQDYENGRFYMEIKDEYISKEMVGLDNVIRLEYIKSIDLSKILQDNNVTKMTYAFPSALNPSLRRVVEVNCDNDAFNVLVTTLLSFKEILKIERIPVYQPTYTPNDYYLQGSDNALELINTLEAWDITKGKNTVNIAIFESGGFDTAHEDLVSQINFKDGNVEWVNDAHGTQVAGCAGAATDNGIGKSGISFNCKLWLYFLTPRWPRECLS